MINRVFCYSKEEAKKNGNKLPILQLVILTIVFVIGTVAVAVISESVHLFILMLIAFMTALIYYSILLGLRMKSKMTGYAIDNQGRVFKAMTVNNGQGLYFGGVAVGSMIDQLANNSSNIGESLGGAVGAVAQFYAISKSAEYMSHPEIVARMVEEAPNITGAEVFEILKVYSAKETKHSLKIKCDYKIIRTNKIKYNKSLIIDKSYNYYQDLINAINSHR